MNALLITLSVLFILSTVAALSIREEWWIRAFDFPYLHFTALGLICVIGWYIHLLLGLSGASPG